MLNRPVSAKLFADLTSNATDTVFIIQAGVGVVVPLADRFGVMGGLDYRRALFDPKSEIEFRGVFGVRVNTRWIVIRGALNARRSSRCGSPHDVAVSPSFRDRADEGAWAAASRLVSHADQEMVDSSVEAAADRAAAADQATIPRVAHRTVWIEGLPGGGRAGSLLVRTVNENLTECARQVDRPRAALVVPVVVLSTAATDSHPKQPHVHHRPLPA